MDHSTITSLGASRRARRKTMMDRSMTLPERRHTANEKDESNPTRVNGLRRNRTMDAQRRSLPPPPQTNNPRINELREKKRQMETTTKGRRNTIIGNTTEVKRQNGVRRNHTAGSRIAELKATLRRSIHKKSASFGNDTAAAEIGIGRVAELK